MDRIEFVGKNSMKWDDYKTTVVLVFKEETKVNTVMNNKINRSIM